MRMSSHERLWEQVRKAVKALEAATNPKPYVEVRRGDVIRRRPVKA